MSTPPTPSRQAPRPGRGPGTTARRAAVPPGGVWRWAQRGLLALTGWATLLMAFVLCTALFEAAPALAQSPPVEATPGATAGAVPGAALSGPQPLRLAPWQADVEAWSAVQVLVDPTGGLTLPDALQRLADFKAPTGPQANLGVRRDAVWLRVPLVVAERDDGRWLLDIDYPSLDRIDVHLLRDGRTVREASLGDHLPYADRPMPARSHVLPLTLEPGARYELLLRVQTRSTMIVPLRLVKAEAYAAREARAQMLQGLAAGVGLCMMMYALAHWLSSRETMFLYYAVTMVGITLFFFAYYGLAPQYLWPHQPWLTDNIAPFAVLLGLAGGLPLIERLLDVRSLYPRLAQLMLAMALVALGVMLLFVTDVISYRAAHLISTLMGPTPVVLAVRVAWVRWRRQGDQAAPYLFAGWGVYALGVAVMAALLRGWIGSDSFTQHAFQAASMFEAAMWLRVLGVRNEEARQRAEKADRERELLQTLAHTDALTGLPNRRGLEQTLLTALPTANANRLMAVFLVDLDGFKAVNDRLGHDAGDALLKAVGQRLCGELRHRDVVARLGGDEFVILARDLAGEPDAWQLGRKLVAAFRQPFDIDGQACSVGLTVGFALAPLDGHDATSLLRRADAAMYAGKQSGKGTVRRGAASIGLVGA